MSISTNNEVKTDTLTQRKERMLTGFKAVKQDLQKKMISKNREIKVEVSL